MGNLIRLLAYLANITILFLFMTFILSCGDDDEETESGAADFSPTEQKILVGGQVNFQDRSTGDVSALSWEFEGGSPGTSTDLNPVVTYNQPGSFNVTLTATDARGDKTTKDGVIEVLAEAMADFTADVTTIDVDGQVIFTASPSDPMEGLTWNWSFEGGIPATSTESTVTVTYILPGKFDASLTVSNELSTDTELKTEFITVVAAPGTVQCFPTETTGSDGTSSSFTYDIDFRWQRLDEFLNDDLVDYLLASYTDDRLDKVEKFDALNQLVTTETFLYNDDGQVSRYSLFDETGAPQFFTDFTYEAGSENPITSITQQSDGIGGFTAFDVTYEYDDNDNVSLETFNFFGTNTLVLTVAYEYDDKNNPFNTLKFAPPPIGNNINNIISIITRDADGNEVDKKTFELTYNPEGYPATTKQTNFDLSTVTFTNSYNCPED
ncbi:PKD domain-containing protein [Fulvivirgaceae bacterium BMA12]|uniref:PKD domain-containing protein n=1 Tax=Agaribacillus aureus TaxID=3051825 RepID=A0ABT8L9M2_9BACT|nr:PKD domain-containing protein [Fulvivirgaceae bacterium BMA12]